MPEAPWLTHDVCAEFSHCPFFIPLKPGSCRNDLRRVVYSNNKSQSETMELRFPYVTRARFDNTEGVNDAWHFIVKPGIGKDNRKLPYVMVHEWAANLAQFL